MNTENNPFVSVWMTTFNHEKFISQAIESVIIQKTSFAIELIIGEDCSTDNTKQLIVEFKKKYPDIVKPIFRSSNIGMMQNAINTLSKCRGKYIAILEGDDYWTDSLKLQKQVDFLEVNSGFVMSCHNAEIVDYEGRSRGLFNTKQVKPILSLVDIIKKWQIPTASMVFMKESLNIPEWLTDVSNGDLAIQCILASKGNVNYMEDIMCAYRKHPSGSSTLVNRNAISYLENHKMLWIKINEYYSFKYNSNIRRKILRVNWQIFKQKLLKASYLLRLAKRIYYKFKI